MAEPHGDSLPRQQVRSGLRTLLPGDPASVAYGPVPYALFEQIRLGVIAVLKARKARAVRRTE